MRLNIIFWLFGVIASQAPHESHVFQTVKSGNYNMWRSKLCLGLLKKYRLINTGEREIG